MRADSRYTTDPFRDAVRQVADLLAGGSGRPAAITRADQLRTDLGLPFRVRGGAPGVDTALDGPQPVPTTSNDSDPTPPTSVPPLVSTTSPSTTPPSTTSVDVPGVGRSVTVGGDPEAPGDPYGSYDATYSGVSQETADWAHGVLRDLVGGEPDLDVLAGQLLHLGPGVQADAATVDRLYELVEAADTAGRATSLAAIGAFDLDQRGALDDQWLVRDTGGRRVGRDWTGNAGRPRVDRYLRVSPDGRTASVDAPWPQQRWVVSAEGGPEGPWVRDRDDNVLVPNSWAEFAELLRHDPAWRQRGDLVIAVPQAGSQTLEGPSLVSDLLRVRTWSTNGTLDWNGRTRSGDPLIRVTGTAVVWVPNRPGQRSGAIPGSVRDIYGSLIDDRDIASTTMVSGDGQRSYGRSMLASDDPVRRAHGNVGGQIMHFSYGEVEPGPGRSWRIIQESAAVHPLPFRPGYVMNFHGSATTGEIPLEEDDPTEAPLGEVAGFFGRRGSFQAVRPRDIVFAEGCEVADYPPGTNDPLHHPRGLQHMANTLNRPVAAANRTIIIRPPADGRPARFVVQTQDVRNPGEVRWITAYPEPDHDEFLEIAARIGGRLPQTPSPRQLLTWLRAAREVYGPDFGPDSQGFDLTMQALGLIDFQRISQGGTGPLTLPWLGEFTQPYNQAYNYPADSWNGLRWLIHNMSSTTTGGDPQAPTDASDTNTNPDIDTTRPAGLDGGFDAVPPPDVPHGVDNSVATSVLERGGQDWWRARAAAGDPVLRQHTWTSVNRQTPDMNGVLQPTTVHGTFRVRRFTHNDVTYTDIEVRTALTTRDPLTAQQLADLWTELSADIDAVYNTPGHKLPNGDILHVTPVRVAHGDPDTDWLADVYTPAPGKRPSHHRLPVNLRAGSRIGAHEFGHQVGLPDEYTDKSTSKDIEPVQGINISGSLMGRYNQPIDPTELETYEREAAEGRPTLTGDGLAQGGLRDRNLGRIARFVGDLPTSTPRITPPPTGLPDETLTGLTDFHATVDRALQTIPTTSGITDDALDAYNDFNNLLETTLRIAQVEAGLDTPPLTVTTVGGDPQAPVDTYEDHLIRIFGPGVTQLPGYQDMHDALARLDTLRGTDSDPALRQGPLDLDAVTRRVLVLPPGTPLGTGHYDALFRFTTAPDAAQASSLAAVAAIGLVMRGAMSKYMAVTAPDDTPYGRDWGSSPVADRMLDMDLGSVWQDNGAPSWESRTTDPRPAPWSPAAGKPRPYVIKTGGSPYALTVTTLDGATTSVPVDVFAELLALDPALTALPPDVPVLLLVPHAGGRQLELPRALAHRLDRPVWSTSGNPDTQRADDGKVRIFLEKRTGLPVGDWILSRPGEVMSDPTTQTTDVPAWERNMVSYTVIADDDPTLQIGRAAFHPQDFSTRESIYRTIHRARLYARFYPAIRKETAPTPLTVGAAPGERVHHVLMHGAPDAVSVPQQDGSTYRASGEEITGWLKRRPSVKRLRDQDWIDFDLCFTGGAYRPGAARLIGSNVALPPATDPLAQPPLAQIVANGTRKRVRAADRVSAYAVNPSTGVPRFLLHADARGNDSRALEFWPEPLDAELADLARTAGLHTGPDPVPGHTLDTTLRLVRALRHAFGPGIGPGLRQDPTYPDLLHGIGALEKMRDNDPHLRDITPFTLELFTRAARADRRDHGDGRDVLDADTYRGLLTRAATAPPNTSLSDFVQIPLSVRAADQLRNLPHVAALATRLLQLPPSAPVGAAEMTRLYWAYVEAAEWIQSVPDIGATAAAALHLPTPDPALQGRLVELATAVIAAGLNPRNPAELGAFDLVLRGALGDHSLYFDPSGRPVGRNWSAPQPGQVVDSSAVLTATRQPQGTYGLTGSAQAPWVDQGKHGFVVSAQNAGPGRVRIALPGMPPVDVTNAEVAELLALDPALAVRDLRTTQVVLAVHGSGGSTAPATGMPPVPPSIDASLPLRFAVALSTGRTVWAPQGRLQVAPLPNSGHSSLTGIFDTPGTTAAADFVPTSPDFWIPAAAVSAAPLAPTHSDGSVTSQPPSQPQDPYRDHLVRSFGTDIVQSPRYQQLHDAVGRLDTLRANDSDPALRQGPLDLDAVTRRVLVLDAATPLTTEHYDMALLFAGAPGAAQAPGLATIAAIGLAMRGALSGGLALTSPDGTRYGRDWGSVAAADRTVDLDLDSVWQDNGAQSGRSRTTDPRPAPWRPAAGKPRPYVIKTGGSPYALTVTTPNDDRMTVPVDVFAELLALDPALTALPPDVPVVLLVPHAGGRQLELPRALAHRLDRPVWSTSGNPETQKADDGKVRVFLEKRTGLPVGDWITSRPDEVMSDPTTQTTDVPAWERDMVSYTVVADDDPTLQIGRAVLDPSDFATREATYRKLNQDYLLHRYVSSARALKQGVRPRVGAAPGEPVHHVFMHGTPEYVQVPQKDGSVYPASGEEITGWLKRRPSVSRLGDRGWINFDACWTGGAYRHGAYKRTHSDAPLPRAVDPLTTIPLSQVVANGTRKRVRAGDRVNGYDLDPDTGKPRWFVFDDVRGGLAHTVEYYPEPLDTELADLARTAGLHTGPDPVPGHTLDTTLRLVRALRQTFGPRVGEDPSYHDLVRGIGAVERMRSDDPQLKDVAPFTLDLFKRAAAANRRDHGDGRILLSADAYRAFLARAVTAPPGTALSDFVTLPMPVWVAGQFRTMRDPAAFARRALQLPPSAPVGTTEMTQAYWAFVKASEWFQSLPDRGTTAAVALHLPAPDSSPSRGLQLVDLATTAFAAGHDAYNLLQLAAFQLTLRGAFDPHSRYVDPSGRVVGRNWGRQRPHQTQQLDSSALVTLTQRADGSYARSGPDTAPWAGPDTDPYLVSTKDNGHGRYRVTLRGGQHVDVPRAELAELLALDPDLLRRNATTTQVVLNVSRTGGSPAPAGDPLATAPPPLAPTMPLQHAVALATGRTVWAPKGTSEVRQFPGTGHLSLTGVFDAPGTKAASDFVPVFPDFWASNATTSAAPPPPTHAGGTTPTDSAAPTAGLPYVSSDGGVTTAGPTAPDSDAEDGYVADHTDLLSEEGPPPTVPPPPRTQVESSYVRRYGALPDGSVGLVQLPAFSPEVLAGLHEQVYSELGVDPDNPPADVREQVEDRLSGAQLALNLAYVRSAGGHRVTIRVDGTDHTIDVQLTLSHPRPSTRQGLFDTRDPDKHVERRGFGTRETYSGQPSGTYRTFQAPWTGSWPIGAGTAVRAVDGAATASITHNQASDSATVTYSVQTTTSQRSNEPSDPIEFDTHWRVRRDAPNVPEAAASAARTGTPAPTSVASEGWSAPQSHGPTTIWFPRHLTAADPAPDSLPEPADLHELPLYGVDSVIDPGALYEHVHQSFRADLDDTAAEQVSTFLSEQVLRGTLPMQIDEGLHSPVITDGSGNVVGMLRLETTPVVAPAQRQSVEGQINLESHVVNYSKVSLSSKYTSGIAITGNVAAALTGDHSEGHPHSADTIGGSAGARGQAQINVSNTYGAESSSGTMHAVRTNRSHLLAPAAVGYRVTLIRPDGTESPAPVFSPKHGMDLRVLSKADAEGHRPSDEELRELPDSLEHLDGLGLSAAPLDVTGTAALYDRAEAWLRREGFLPPAPGTPAATGLGAKLKKLARDHEPEHQIRLHAQLNNLRKLRDARSRVGRRAGSDSMIDGGQSLHFEIPTGTDTGVRRVRLQLTAERDTSRESRHDKVLPGIQVMGLALGVGSDSEQLGESYGGGAGPLGSVSGPLGNWGGFGFGGDYQYVHQYTDGDGVGGSTGHDQFFIGTAQDTHKFEVPVRLALDLFADDGDRPSVRFGEEVNAAAAAAATPAAPAVPTASTASAAPAPPTVSGSMWLAVPHSRTRAPAPKPAPRPRAGHAGGVPRRPNPTDMARLEGTDATGAPLPNLVRVPDDALIDVMRGSAVVDSLFQRAAAEIRRQVRASETAADDSGTGPILPLTTADAGRTTGTGDGRQSRKWTSPLAGQGLTDTRTRAAESRYAATTPGSLIAHGHELLKNTYVVEGLTLSGALSDGQYTLELRAIAHDPELLGTDKQYTETGAGAVDTAQQSKSLGKSHQVGFTGLASQNPPPVPENDENSPELVNPEIDGTIGVTNRAGTKRFVGLFNPSARFGYTFRTDESDALSSSTAVNRVPTESGEKHRVKSGLTYVLTLRAGSRTAFNGPGELGTIDPVTFAADVPGGLEFLMTRGQHLRDARWMSSVRGLTAESAPKLTAGLPSSYTRDRELGLGTVLSVIEYQRPAPAAPPAAPAPVATSGTAAPASTPAIPLGPVTPRERRGQVYRDMVELVEIEAPGATTPGHPGYQSGVHSRIAQITSTAGLRSLPGRGPGGTFGRATTRFHFRHHGFGGERLVEVALAAVPRRSQDLAGVRGVSHPGSGFEQWQSHTAAGRTTSKSWVRQKQLGVNLTTRHLRRNQPPGQSRVDRSAPVLTPQAATSKSSRRATTADNRFWLRTDNGADFDGLEYDYVVSVRSVLVMDWPPNVLGGLIQNGVIAWEQASVNTRRWLDELLERGRPQTRSTPVRLALRFTGTETNTRTTPASVTAPAAVSTVDPRNRLLPGPPPTPYLTDSQMFSPTGPTPVFHFDGWAHLETALNEVTPISDGGWHVQLTGASLEGRAARLGQLVQAGRISLDRPRLVAGLLRRMPGSRPLEGPPTQPPSLTITLYNPRRATHGDDVTLDQLHNVTDTLSTAAGADHTFSVGFTELLSADADGHQLAGMSVPIVQRPAQPTSFGGTVTGSRRDWLKHGSTSAPGDGARGTRSYAIDADVHLLVEGPEGTRHVTGTATLRVEERDLLGHGLITEEESPPRVRDLPSLVPDWDTGELSDLSQRLHSALNTEVDGVQLWVSLGPDQDGVRLGRVLYGASRAAVLGNRPVELMTRGPEGIRRWEFNSEGSLVTDDPQLTEAWTPFHAQAQLLHSATLTLADAPGQLRRLTMALRHADHALTHAVVALESARDMVRTAITAEERAKARAALSIKTARQHRKLVGTLEQGLKTAQQTVATLPPVIAANEKTAADARRDLRTALDRLTQVENTVRAERAAAAAKGSSTRTGQDAQGVGSAVPPAGRPSPPAPSESPAATGAPRSGRPAADVADDPRVRAVLPAITAAENALQEVTKQLEENSGKLRKAQKIVTDGPARVQEAQTTRDEAVEQAGRDAAAVVSRGEDVRIARLRESRAEKRVERAETKVLRRNDQLATAADARARALSDHSSATEALEDLSTAVRDNAPAPEQSLRTTFATTSPRWPRPGGRLAPLPAAGQSHSAIPRVTTDPARITRKSTFKLGRTGTAKPTHPDIPKITRTGTSKPTHTMPAHSGTVATGKGKEAAAAPVTRETPYIAPRGALVPTPGDNRCLLSAVIGSAPQLVRTRLQEAGLPVGPRVATWLGRPTGVQQTLRSVALKSGGGRDARHLRTVQDQLQNLVQNRLAAAIDGTRPLSPQVLGQLRSLLVTEFAAQVRDESDAWVDARLIQFGIGGLARPEDLDPTELQTLYAVEVSRQDAPHPAAGESPSNVQMFDYLRRRNALPALPNLTPEQRRELLITEYHHSTVPLTTPEANRLNRAVRNWSTEWNSLMGDVFLPLLADTLDAPIDVFTHAPGPVAEGGTLGFVIRYGPDSHTPALEVHYTGLNHYSASAAATHLSLAPPTAGPPSSLSSAREDSIEPPTPTMEGSSVGSVGDGSRGEDDGPAPVSYGERPDSFVASLASLLTGPGTAPAWAGARDPQQALRGWALSDAADRGVPADAALPDGDTDVSYEDLDRLKVLDDDQLRAQAILQGSLTVAEAGLDDAARLALVLANPDTLAYVLTLAALVARDTGRRIRLVPPGGGEVREFGPAGGTPLTVYFDGDRFTTTPPAPDDD
ncbi:lonely Cys domain-containing protein [Streptomyces griseoaurantiacus]|uniref:lonely Cys domain-containing protein n=1 Tax=Streptomyces griseoaurantiacus TaxID=68213 RepID=UPI001BC97D8C|nr:lonely Cys domain-containing protein [Streptomyces griseoaurantiacus]